MSLAWSTQQLAEFMAAAASASTEAEAARTTVEWIAEVFDAEVAGIVYAGEVLAAVGYPDGAVSAGELAAITPDDGGELLLPKLGSCPTRAVYLEHPPGATLVVARRNAGLDARETSLLRGIAQTSSAAMRMLRLLEDERAAGEQRARRQDRLEQLANEQTALRAVATLVARGVVAYDAAELATMIGRSTSELPAELRRPAVHADDLVAV